jgi:hypothetical protein
VHYRLVSGLDLATNEPFVSFETLLGLITGLFDEGDPLFREAGCQGLDY